MTVYLKWQIQAALKARHNLRSGGVSIKNMTPARLGVVAASHRTHSTRLAAIAELVSRIDPNAVLDMMLDIPVSAPPDRRKNADART